MNPHQYHLNLGQLSLALLSSETTRMRIKG